VDDSLHYLLSQVYLGISERTLVLISHKVNEDAVCQKKNEMTKQHDFYLFCNLTDVFLMIYYRNMK
jgi:hypothetical protein